MGDINSTKEKTNQNDSLSFKDFGVGISLPLHLVVDLESRWKSRWVCPNNGTVHLCPSWQGNGHLKLLNIQTSEIGKTVRKTIISTPIYGGLKADL